MRGRVAAFVLICATAIAPANARAMSASAKSTHGSCRVVSGEKMLARVGGAEALCTEVARAIAAAAPKARYFAEVTVMPRSQLSAALVVNGRVVPAQKFAMMDSELDQGAIKRFAEGIARAVADAAKP